MRIDWEYYVVIAMLVGLIVTVIVTSVMLGNAVVECKDKGGVMLQTAGGYVCVDAKTIGVIK